MEEIAFRNNLWSFTNILNMVAVTIMLLSIIKVFYTVVYKNWSRFKMFFGHTGTVITIVGFLGLFVSTLRIMTDGKASLPAEVTGNSFEAAIWLIVAVAHPYIVKNRKNNF